jgi:hypothetical protein
MSMNNHAFPLTAIDREILAMKDEDFALVTWEQLKEIIGMLFRRAILCLIP